ncbi:MAG TPA: 16S rRNA (uracil(1498)-N(3))-methyltransferase, partial [Bacteroidales bacterium]|nr:16S rRNA (uracil(1498)-N(3))-methyltransferase [Bacteroidales bacterium]
KEKNKKSILLEIKEIETFQAEKQKIQIAIAPTKGNDRFEWFIEKAVEIGVTDIYPFYSEFSERKRINLNRLNKIMISALKQSMRVFIPNIMPIQSFKEIIALPELKHSISYIAHCKKDNLPLLKNKTLKHDTCIMIGPEGGFSTKEITMATNAGWQEVSLGQYRFRTETSGIAAALTVKIIQE